MRLLPASIRSGADLAEGGVEWIWWRGRVVVLTVASVAVMTIGALLTLVIALLTLCQARRLYTEVLAKWIGRTILWMWGIRVILHPENPFPLTQAMYISNHTSTLDLFVLIALGLPNTRYFLSGYLRTLLPLGVMGYFTGIFWTVPQEYADKRVRCFQEAERALRRTGESVYLSPEGERVTTGQVGHFNKGAFHLATTLGAPIVPLYLYIPRDSDPGKGFDARPGTVHVYVNTPISTSNWTLDDLDRNRRRVRRLFVEFHRQFQVRERSDFPDRWQ